MPVAGLPDPGPGRGVFSIWIDFGFQNYYALLDCGFRIRPTAGTASGVHPVPLGFGSAHVHLDPAQDFDGAAWLRGLNQGRSFVTTGPMLLVTAPERPAGRVLAIPECRAPWLQALRVE